MKIVTKLRSKTSRFSGTLRKPISGLYSFPDICASEHTEGEHCPFVQEITSIDIHVRRKNWGTAECRCWTYFLLSKRGVVNCPDYNGQIIMKLETQCKAGLSKILQLPFHKQFTHFGLMNYTLSSCALVVMLK